MGAVVLNYTAAEEFERENDVWRVTLKNQNADKATVSGKVLFNFTGAWIDRVDGMNPAKTQPKRQIIWVKGVSIALQLPEKFNGVGIAGLNSEDDAIMCVPSGQLRYIGPTETVYEGDIDM